MDNDRLEKEDSVRNRKFKEIQYAKFTNPGEKSVDQRFIDFKDRTFEDVEYDFHYINLILNFGVEMMNIFFTILGIYFFVNTIRYTFEYLNCPFYQADKAASEVYFCNSNPNNGYFSFINFMNIAAAIPSAVIIFYTTTQSSTKPIGYMDLNDALKWQKISSLIGLSGDFGGWFANLLSLTYLIKAILFFSDYNQMEPLGIFIPAEFVDFVPITILTNLYLIMRFCYCLFNRCIGSCVHKDSPPCSIVHFYAFESERLEKRDIKNFIFERDDVKENGKTFHKAMNIIIGVLTLLSVLFGLIWLFVCDAKTGIENTVEDKTAIKFVLTELFILSLIHGFIYAIFCFKNFDKKISNHFSQSIFTIFNVLNCFSLTDDNFFKNGAFITVAVLLGILLICATVSFAMKKKSEKTKKKLKWEELLNALITTTICASMYLALLHLMSGFFDDDSSTIGFRINWNRDISDNSQLQKDLMTFRTSDTVLNWTQKLIYFMNIDVILIFFFLFLLIVFTRMFCDSLNLKLILLVFVYYSIYATFRADGFTDAVFEPVDNGFAVMQPSTIVDKEGYNAEKRTEKNFLNDILKANKISIGCFILMLATLEISPNIKPIPAGNAKEIDVVEEKSSQNDKMGVTVAILILLLFIFVAVYLFSAAVNYDWLILNFKKFDESYFNVNSPSICEIAQCSKMMTAAEAENLSKALKALLENLKAFVAENKDFFDQPIKEFFEQFDDKLAFLLCPFLSILFFILHGLASISRELILKCHILLIGLTFLNLIYLNTTYLIICNFVRNFPGMLYTIDTGEGFNSANFLLIYNIFLLLFSYFAYFAPVQIPNITPEDYKETDDEKEEN